jgi:hypothetical protein
LRPVFMFCAPGLIFGGTEGVGSRFHVLRSQTRFRQYGGRRVPFSCFALPNSFSTVRRASGPVFVFCVPGLIFGGIDGFRSRFHILPARTRFRRYGGRRVQFSCFARSDSFSAVPRASDPVFLFCVLGLVFGGTEGVGSRYHVLRVRTRFSTEGVGSRFHILRSRTRFQLFRWLQVPFSYFAPPDSFSSVRRASGSFFMFCAPELIFGGTEGVRSRFHVLRAQTRFRR